MTALMKNETIIKYETSGLPIDTAPCLIVWGHGWGQNRQTFAPMAQALSQRAAHLLLDFPGFGESPLPQEVWGTAEYADAVANLIAHYRNIKKIIWVGHSFGGRVGIQLAARHPETIDGLFLLASAGLPRRRTFAEKLKYKSRIYTFKLLKRLAPLLGISVDGLRKKFGSADYKSAGALRPLFLAIIREDLSERAQQIACPVHLVYGLNDAETPPDIGERLAKLIPNARLSILPKQDHYSLLEAGRHLVLKRLTDFMEKV
jgi:pimeloyl-ACP methyl ester carboxylesterase